MSEAEVKKVFQEYAAFGRPPSAKGSAKDMTGKNFMKMCKDKKLVDKNLTTTEIDMIYTKCTKAKGKPTLTYEAFKEALAMLSKSKYKKEEDECLTKLKGLVIQGDGPTLAGTTKTSTKGGVASLTDTSKYTGSHKERFDESGKGKGKAGRDDLAAQTGYVGAYKGEGTYDKKVKGK